MVVSATHSIMTQACPSKVVINGEYAFYDYSKAVDQIDLLGHSRIIMKSHKESSLKALQLRIKRRRDKDTVLQNSLKGDSQSKEAVAKATHFFAGVIRAMGACLEEDLGPGCPSITC